MRLRDFSIIFGFSLLCACSALGTSGADFREIKGNGSAAMTADYRVVSTRTRRSPVQGGIETQVYCAEPSPDIGRIVSASQEMGVTASAKGLKNVQPELALAFAASRAEGLAQLGQRLATIQLLRDSTYRACEAYANGAISSATYAMIVSRYDDVMTTLLLGEMAAGAARQTNLAILAGSASTKGLSQANADAAVKAALDRITAANKAVEDAQAALKAITGDDGGKAAKAVDAAMSERASGYEMLTAALGASGGTAAGTAGQPGNTSQSEGAQVSEQLAQMQKAYLEDFNLDAVMVGCLSTLSLLDKTGLQNPDAAPASVVMAPPSPDTSTSLQDECRLVLKKGETLQNAARTRMELVILRAQAEKMAEERRLAEAQARSASTTKPH